MMRINSGNAVGLLLAITLWAGMCVPAQAQFTYRTNSGTITITGYEGPGGAVIVPEQIDGLPVTAIGEVAFQNNTNINTISIPDTVTSIGMRAFAGCSWLFGVTMSNVMNIHAYAFYRCFQLVDVVIPQTAANIGHYAFAECPSLRDVRIPDGVKGVGVSAFQGCWRLENVVIGNGVRYIGDQAFSGCPALTNATIGSSVTNIGYAAFGGCRKLASVTIPASVTLLGGSAFRGCATLRSVYFAGNAPASHEPFDGNVTVYFLPGSSGWSATFWGRPTMLWNPQAALSRAGFGFSISGSSNIAAVVEVCTNLASGAWFPVGTNTLLGGTSWFSDPGWTNASTRFYRFKSPAPVPYDYAITNGTITLTAHLGDGSFLDIPGTINGLPVTAIAGFAFWLHRDLTSVRIPDTVTTLRSLAFAGCYNLTNVVIGKGVTEISGAFYGCNALSAIDVDPDNPLYTSVGGVVFDKRQTTLVLFPRGQIGNYRIPDGVTNIGREAFKDCGLEGVTMSSSVKRIGDLAFDSCFGLTNVTMTESVSEIGASAFYWCSSLTKITIPSRVTSIPDRAFTGCSSLRSVVMGAGVTNIGEGAFAGCPFPGITIPSSVRRIGPSAFEDCGGLTRVTIPDGVRTIGPSAFARCSSLTNVTLGSRVADIGERAFAEIWGLTSIRIPPSVTNLAPRAFASCWNLRSVTVGTNNTVYSSAGGIVFDKSQSTLVLFPPGREGSYAIPSRVTRIADSAFEHSALTNITMPDGLLEIGDGAFRQCRLDYISIPDTVRNIGAGAFVESGLTNVVVGNGVTNIADGVFFSCSRLTTATVGRSVERLGRRAFAYCWYLRAVYFKGDAPLLDEEFGEFTFDNSPVTVYYLAGTSGWGRTFADHPTAVWSP